MLLAFIVVAWDPVQPGALIKEVCDFIIINESVRVILNLEITMAIRNTLSDRQERLKLVKENLIQLQTTPNHNRLVSKLNVVEEILMKLRNNFIESGNRSKR